LPGLSSAGEANASLAQAFNRSLILLMTDSPKEREELRNEVETFSRATTSALNSYKLAIYDQADKERFETLLKRRQEYLEVRSRVFALVESDRRQEAVTLCRN